MYLVTQFQKSEHYVTFLKDSERNTSKKVIIYNLHIFAIESKC